MELQRKKRTRQSVYVLVAWSMLSAFALTAPGLGAADEGAGKTYLAVWATTSNMSLPGMPAEMKMENLPAEAQALLGNFMGPKRQLEVRLWSPGVAPADAGANIDIPGGLKLGPTLPLELHRPEAQGGGGEGSATAIPDFEIRYYWGCSESVREGQPKVVKTSDLSPAMRSQMAKGKGHFWYKPDWTEAFWPNDKSRIHPMVSKESSLQGDYKLHSTYAGEAAFTVTHPVDFLAGVVFTSPAQGKKPDLKKSISLAWQQIPGALGYHVTAMAPKGKNTMVIWSASETESGMQADTEFPQMSEVRAMVDKGIVLPPDKTTCSIPAGIFEGCQMVTLRVVAYGPGQAFEDQTPLVRVQTKSIGMLTLGMAMPQGGGMEGNEGAEE